MRPGHAPPLDQLCRFRRMCGSWMMVVKEYRQTVSNCGVDGYYFEKWFLHISRQIGPKASAPSYPTPRNST
jgi:hypothetical protein